MTMAERVEPYAARLMDDRELQRDLRDAVTALRRGSTGPRPRKARAASRRQEVQPERRARRRIDQGRAGALRGEPPKSHRGRKILIVLLVLVGLGAAAAAAKQMLGEDEFAAQNPSV